MAQYPIKMLKDENGNPFIPLVAPEAVINTDSETLPQLLSGKISEPASDGTAGQVLTTDGLGGRVWTTVQGGGGGGTSDYTALSNKPQINGNTLSGNKTSANLGLQDALVSGTNIKTINNVSILGSGNIDVAPNLDYTVYTWDGNSSQTNPNNIQLFQNILDDHLAGKSVLILHNGSDSKKNTIIFEFSPSETTHTAHKYMLMSVPYSMSISTMNRAYEQIGFFVKYVYIELDSTDLVVSAVTVQDYAPTGNFLTTNKNYDTPYVPLYDGSPATKKYVDDSVATSANIVSVSTTEPTASNAEIWIDPSETPTQAPIQIDTYNTTESTTNKIWIDGKPIYRKVIPIPALGTNETIGVAAGISNFDTLIHMEGNFKGMGTGTGNQVVTRPLNFSADRAESQNIYGFYNVTTGYVRIATTDDWSFMSGYVIMEYTKTTD